MKIISPTYKRAGAVTILGSFPSALLVVPESQTGQYAKHYGRDRLIVMPDRFEGNISRKRNWILDQFVNDDDLLIIDDDTTSVWKFETLDGTTNRIKDYHHKLSPEAIVELAEESFELARGFETVLWGVNQNQAFWTYRASPISLTTVVLGPLMGFCKGFDIRHDERLSLKWDYDISLQVLRKYRKIVRWNKYHYFAAHGTNEGGLTAFRTYDRELEQGRLIMQKWGTDVIVYKPSRKNILNGTVNCPIPGV